MSLPVRTSEQSVVELLAELHIGRPTHLFPEQHSHSDQLPYLSSVEVVVRLMLELQ